MIPTNDRLANIERTDARNRMDSDRSNGDIHVSKASWYGARLDSSVDPAHPDP